MLKDMYCPNCGHTMNRVFCECTSLADIHLMVEGDNLRHSDCGLLLNPEMCKKIKEGPKC